MSPAPLTRPTERTSAHDRSRPATALLLVACWAVLCGVVVAWGWLLTHPLTGSVGAMDDDLARWFARQRTPTLNDLAEVGTFMGETVVGLAVLAAVGLGFSYRHRSWVPAVFVSVVYAGLGGIYVAATHVDTRQRPPVPILDKGLIPDHSFPSGHVGTATAIAGCVLALMWTYERAGRWWAAALLVMPLCTLLARMYQGAHHLTDVLTGLVSATVWIGIVATVLLRGQPERT